MKVLLTSASESVAQSMRLSVAGIERQLGESLTFVHAPDGERAVRVVHRELPELVIADEIQSREGAFSMTKDLRDGLPTYDGVVVILLDRPHDAWLARWAGADAWFVKPADPFALADRVIELIRARRARGKAEREATG